MSRYKTDIECIRSIAGMLLHLDIQSTRISFIVSHPFTDTWAVPSISENGSLKIIDLSSEGGVEEWRKAVNERIEQEDVFGILSMIREPYRLFFLKKIKKNISDEDLGMCLSEIWTTIENISMDVNVSGSQIASMFKRADKRTLMTDKERRYLESLDNEIILYRGVTSYNRSRKKAMSWTLDIDIAKWFAQRFGDGGEVWKAVIPKERVLACFYDKGEGELVVNLYGCNMEIQSMKM